MDPRIILAGRAPDLVGSLARGQAAGQQMLEFQRANELAAQGRLAYAQILSQQS